jgi:hypothetical protein
MGSIRLLINRSRKTIIELASLVKESIDLNQLSKTYVDNYILRLKRRRISTAK